jgi:hypothetical protein
LNSPGAALLLQAAINMLAKNIGGKTIRLQSIGYQVTCFCVSKYFGAVQCRIVGKKEMFNIHLNEH